MKFFIVCILLLLYSCSYKNKDEVIKINSEIDSDLFSYYLNNFKLDSTAIKKLLLDACISRVRILDLDCQVIKSFNPEIEEYEFTYFFKFDSLVAVNQFEYNMDVFSNNRSYDISTNLISVINNITDFCNDQDSVKLFVCELVKLVYIAPFNCGLNRRMNVFEDYCITNSDIKLLNNNMFEDIQNEEEFIRKSIENGSKSMPDDALLFSDCIGNWQGPTGQIQFDSLDENPSTDSYYFYYKTLSSDMKKHQTIEGLKKLLLQEEIIYFVVPNMQFFRVAITDENKLFSVEISWLEPRLIYVPDITY